jgi:hypothetical protein
MGRPIPRVYSTTRATRAVVIGSDGDREEEGWGSVGIRIAGRTAPPGQGSRVEDIFSAWFLWRDILPSA